MTCYVPIYFLLCVFILSFGEANGGRRELILLSAPSKNNKIYEKDFDEIINFQINFTKLMSDKNDVIVLADDDTVPYLTRGNRNVTLDHVMVSNVEDIWIRDFGTVRQTAPVLLGYAPGYLDPPTARIVKNSFIAFLKSAGINVAQTAPDTDGLALTYFPDLVVDGGNVVDDMQTTAILTDRAFLENPKYKNDKERFKADVRKALRYPNVVMISQAGDITEDTTGHSDGMVSFLDNNILVYTQTDEDTENRMISELKTGMGNETKFVRLPSYHNATDFRRGFRSACGLHVNSLVTKNYVYMPVFGHDPEAQRKGYSVANDDLVYGIIRQIIQKNTKKRVVTVPVPYNVCMLGGSVRCLSMQIEGPIADRLVYLATGTG